MGKSNLQVISAYGGSWSHRTVLVCSDMINVGNNLEACVTFFLPWYQITSSKTGMVISLKRRKINLYYWKMALYHVGTAVNGE